MIKKAYLTAVLPFLIFSYTFSQTQEIPGHHIAEIFTDCHLNMRNDDNKTGFAINRAYIGYIYNVDKNFYGNITLNIGSPDELAPGSTDRRYAFFREASLNYTDQNLNISFGMVTARIFSFQQKFLGKRYVANTFESLNGYGFIADLGVVTDYKINDMLDLDLSITNGEGYGSLELDNSIMTGLGITVSPVTEMAIRLYGDLQQKEGLWKGTGILFAGYKNEKFTIGGEICYKSNLDLIAGHNAWGFSATGAVSLAKKLEFFTRYDFSTSSTGGGETVPFNVAYDGKFLINGFQYTFNKVVKLALDNQATFPSDKTKTVSDLIYINALFKF